MITTQTSLQDLFLDSLADIYYAENQLVTASPKMAKAATHDHLKNAFRTHTEGHVKKVGKVFAAFGAKAKAKKCEAIVGLLEGDEMAGDNKGGLTLNAALIVAAQRVEHYEIATHGALRFFLARESLPTGQRQWSPIRAETLTGIARLHANPLAAGPTGTETSRSCCDEADHRAAYSGQEGRITHPPANSFLSTLRCIEPYSTHAKNRL
jgi:ferritin-like metal-binding protein YciE